MTAGMLANSSLRTFQENAQVAWGPRPKYNRTMTKAALALAALELSTEDQLELAQTLWDHNSPPQDESLSPALTELLEARRSEALAHPEAALEWTDVKRRLLAKG